MTQQSESESKTEDPTEKKIFDEYERGNFPVSREASLFAAIAATLLATVFLARTAVRSITLTLQEVASDPGGQAVHAAPDAIAFLSALAWDICRPLIPVLAILLVAGLASAFLQNPPRLVLKRIEPDFARISLANGWQRLFGAHGRIEFVKSVSKLISISVILSAVMRSQWNALADAMLLDPDAVPELVLTIAARLLMIVCAFTAALLAADIFWVRARWRKDIRMTKQEIKDEMKEAEGDPLRKARIRSLALDRRRKRMIDAVPRATLVIANPTHYAVALRYVREEGGAPIVISKGQDFIALKIREIAERHAIPVVEDVALARSLYHAVEVDSPIPPEFYRAVAEIIHLLYAKSGRRAYAK